MDQRRREHGAERDRRVEEAVQHAEDARQHLARRPALQDREAADVADDVREADQPERDQRRGGGRDPAQQQQRAARAGDGDPEGGRQAPVPDEPERGEPADHPADPDGRVQVADAARAEVEQLQGRDRDQHAEGAVHERLRREEPDDEAQPRVARDRAEAGRRLLGQVRALAGQRRLGRAQQRGEHQRREEEQPGGEREDDPDASRRRAGARPAPARRRSRGSRSCSS